jgi:hypothetical protein
MHYYYYFINDTELVFTNGLLGICIKYAGDISHPGVILHPRQIYMCHLSRPNCLFFRPGCLLMLPRKGAIQDTSVILLQLKNISMW